MGIRGIERRLAAELCYEAVADAVDDYLEESRQAGRLLWPHEHLVVPIIRAGYYPPGLLGVKDFIFRHQDVARAERKHMGEEAGELSLPDEGELIEEIMWPYPTARLRARQRREEARLLALRQARESRREDATKCKTMQQKTAEARTPTVTDDDGATGHATGTTRDQRRNGHAPPRPAVTLSRKESLDNLKTEERETIPEKVGTR